MNRLFVILSSLSFGLCLPGGQEKVKLIKEGGFTEDMTFRKQPRAIDPWHGLGDERKAHIQNYRKGGRTCRKEMKPAGEGPIKKPYHALVEGIIATMPTAEDFKTHADEY